MFMFINSPECLQEDEDVEYIFTWLHLHEGRMRLQDRFQQVAPETMSEQMLRLTMQSRLRK